MLTINNDGTILIGGLFTEFNHAPRHGIVRLLADGTVDPTFAAVTMTCPQFPFGASGCGLWADPIIDDAGKIIIAGDFIAVNGVPKTCVARLNANGTLDATFNPSGFTPFGFNAGAPRPIRGIAIQTDGKIVIGGRFSGGTCGNHVPLVRLNTDGSLDNDYLLYTGCLPSTTIGQYPVRNLVKDESDRIIAVGQSMWRFNIDGSLDNAFHNPVFAFAQQQSGGEEGYNVAFADNGTRLFVGGYFSDVDDVGGPAERRTLGRGEVPSGWFRWFSRYHFRHIRSNGWQNRAEQFPTASRRVHADHLCGIYLGGTLPADLPWLRSIVLNRRTGCDVRSYCIL